MSTTADFSEVLDAFAERVAELVLERLPQPITESESSEFMRVPEAAQFLGLTVPAVRMLVKRGEIPAHKVGSRVLFARDELREWVCRASA